MINPAPRATIVSALLHPQDYRDVYAQLSPHSSEQGRVLTDTPNGRPSPRKEHRPALEAMDEDEDEELLELSGLTDTSILFRRYLEAGKMVNVYDLFQSFAGALDAQRQQQQSGSQSPAGPSRNAARNRRRSLTTESTDTEMEVEQALEEDEVEDEEDEDKEDEEWRVEVQARFMRALHELDYMGFVKHTGRKADHVMRTVFDVTD